MFVNANGLIALLLALLLAGGGVLTWFRAEGGAPSVEVPESLVVGRGGATLDVALADPGSGLRAVEVQLVHGETLTVLLAEDYPGNLISGGTRSEQDVELALDPKRMPDVRGDALLRIRARDWSWRGNETVVEIPVSVDVDPPRIEIATGLTYVDQGGAGSVVYRLSEKTVRDGVRVGDAFYDGHPLPGGGDGERIALFAVPATAPADVVPRVTAEDAAGNASDAGWPVVVKPHAMPEANVTLGRSFLEAVVPRLSPDGSASVEAFDDINTRLRAENEAKIRELIVDSAPRPLFEGPLRQQPSSKVTSRFGERRTYFLDGKAVSHAVHYGYDLASYAAAPIVAAGAGRVLYADDLGIYGSCVLVDHGLGLVTLYGHLSRIDVSAGDSVEQGQRLGLSGATGLAGGDHLHFAVLVGDTYVDPREWWDPRWVQTRVSTRLARSGP